MDDFNNLMMNTPGFIWCAWIITHAQPGPRIQFNDDNEILVSRVAPVRKTLFSSSQNDHGDLHFVTKNVRQCGGLPEPLNNLFIEP